MNSSFDHLLDLAQKTGNNLIIYDRYGDRNLVVLDLSEYERLVDIDIGRVEDSEFGEDIGEMNEGEMLDKINHDIAAWRSYQEQEDSESREEKLEEEMKNDQFDPFSEDYSHNDEWQSAGDILQERHPELASSEFNSGITFPAKPLLPLGYEPVGFVDPYQPSSERQVPYQEHDEAAGSASEPLEDEPIFFEEPLE